MATRHWLVTLAAIWSAVSGFTLQRRIVNRPARVRGSGKSTPFTRWRAGHVVRLWSAASVGLWALLLSDFAGPRWLVSVFFVFSLLLLLLWWPGPAPHEP